MNLCQTAILPCRGLTGICDFFGGFPPAITSST